MVLIEADSIIDSITAQEESVPDIETSSVSSNDSGDLDLKDNVFGIKDKDEEDDYNANADNDECIVTASKKAFLSYYGLTKVCVTTVCRWMKVLGMNYCLRKFNFYVDGHERADNVAYREKYIPKYFIDEQQMYRWVQISEAKYNELVRNTFILF